MKRLRQPWLWCVLIGLIVLSLIVAAYRFSWQGTGFQGKTVWDWLSLLVIPLALALVVLFFNQMNTSTERQIAEQRYEQDQQIALDKQREDVLQAYLDRMSELLLEKGLRTSQPDAEVRNVARTRTISVLRQLDGRRVGDVFAFLAEAGLVKDSDPIVSLEEADFSYVNWEGANLFRINFAGTDLSDVILFGANLSGVDLTGADLGGTNLNKASLRKAFLGMAFLGEALLEGADLSGANLSGANLNGARLKDAKIEKGKLTPEQIAQAIWD